MLPALQDLSCASLKVWLKSDLDFTTHMVAPSIIVEVETTKLLVKSPNHTKAPNTVFNLSTVAKWLDGKSKYCYFGCIVYVVLCIVYQTDTKYFDLHCSHADTLILSIHTDCKLNNVMQSCHAFSMRRTDALISKVNMYIYINYLSKIINILVCYSFELFLCFEQMHW